jgi:hypothetical protein
MAHCAQKREAGEGRALCSCLCKALLQAQGAGFTLWGG